MKNQAITVIKDPDRDTSTYQLGRHGELHQEYRTVKG